MAQAKMSSLCLRFKWSRSQMKIASRIDREDKNGNLNPIMGVDRRSTDYLRRAAAKARFSPWRSAAACETP